MRDWKKRVVYFVSAVAVMSLGLVLRRYEANLPNLFGDYVGDVLWALMVFLGISFFVPSTSVVRRGAVAIAFAYTIELSQFYHAPWIDALRQTTLGGLVLGFGVLWTDFVCYAIGIALGMLGDGWLIPQALKAQKVGSDDAGPS